MSAVWLRVRVFIGRRWLALVVTAVLVGLAGGVVMGIAAGTRRTDSAPDRYTAQAGGDPALYITQPDGESLDDAVALMPGVTDMQSITFVFCFPASPLDGPPLFEPNPFAGDDDAVGARIIDGRYADPANPNEFTVNRPMAAMLRDQFGTRVGDTFDVSCFSQDQLTESLDLGAATPEMPSFPATLVGVTESPMEFDDASMQMVFPRSFLAAHPGIAYLESLIVVHLAPGTDPRAVVDAVRQLPNGAGAYSAPIRIVSDATRRAVRFQATSLWLVSAITLIAAAVLIAQVCSRTLRVGDDERRSMTALGWRRGDLALERIIEGSIAAIIAAPVTLTVGYAISARFPLGRLRSLEPRPGAHLDWFVAVIVVAITLAVVVVTALLIGMRRSRVPARREATDGPARALFARTANMPLRLGAGFASTTSRGRRSWPSVLVGSFALATLVGSMVVGLSLTKIVDRADRWGVNYDAFFGNPYVDVDVDLVGPVTANPDVEAVTGAHLGSVVINGADTATIGFHMAKGDLHPTVLSGRSPSRPDEIAVGAEVARRLDIHIGDHVEVEGTSGEPRQLTLVGTVVTPGSAGDGAALTFDGYKALNPEATENMLLVKYREDAPANVSDSIAATIFTPPDALVTPASVRALERATAGPSLLAAVLTLLLLVASAYLLTTSVRARHRDLAILRALGSNGRQLRATVHWQATIAAAMVTAVGLPLGIVVGRWVVSRLTNALGIVPGADVPVLLVIAVALAVLLVANALALLPARRAARVRIAQLSLDR